MLNHFVQLVSMMFLVSAISTQSQAAPPPRSVLLQCSPLPYVFSCSIPRTAHPQFGTHCWYRANGEGYLMKSDRRFGFYNDIVEMKLRDSTHVTAEVRELKSGRKAHCSSHGLDNPSHLTHEEESFSDLDFFETE